LSSGYVDVIGVSGNNLTVAVSGSSIGSDAGVLRRTSNNVALASGSTYTISFLMRQTSGHTIGGYYAVITGGAAGDLGAGFNVSGSFSSGQIFTYTGATSRIRRVERWGTDVYRCSETFTMTASGTLTQLGLGPTTAVNNAAHPAVGLGIAFAAPQIELGAVPTTFMPTTTVAVTRNADNISLSSAVSGCIGQTEGTIYAEFEYRTDTSTRRILTLSDGNQTNRVMLIFAAGFVFAQINAQSINIGTPVVGYNKAAFGYIQNGVSGTLTASLNGAAVVSGTSATYPASLNTVNLGKIEDTATTGQINSRIRSAALYTSRLTNAELIALSTL
jgi:tetrahydromethanopterin S-methyltransferase subunit D